MKRSIFAAGLVILVFVQIILARTQARSVEQELIALEKEWNDAWVKRDLAVFDRIMADDFIVTGDGGNLVTKAEDIENVRSGKDVATYQAGDEFRVNVYGDTAVVRYRMTVKGRWMNRDYSCHMRWTDTWIKRNGRWQVVAAHCSRID